MEKTLKKIQKFAKAGSVLCKIVLWCSIIGFVACTILLIAQLIVGDKVMMADSTIVRGLFVDESNFNLGTLYAGSTIGIILCICEIINSKLALNYFENELKEGSPYTISLADQLKKLGIQTIIISILGLTLSNVAYVIFSHFYIITNELEITDFSSVGIGIGFILVSLLCRYSSQNDE